MTPFAMFHDAFTKRRYAMNPLLVRTISEPEDGEGTLIMFDSHIETKKWIRVAESFPEAVTEMNRATMARIPNAPSP